jgi:hypothetical protein
MATLAAATNGASEHAAKATAQRADDLLAVHGIPSATIGFKLAWGRTPHRDTLYLFYFLHYFLYSFNY